MPDGGVATYVTPTASPDPTCHAAVGAWVWGFGFGDLGVSGLRFRVWDSDVRFLGCRFLRAAACVCDCGFRVWKRRLRCVCVWELSVLDKGLWGCNLFEREGDVPRDHVFPDPRRLPPQRDPPVVQV